MISIYKLKPKFQQLLQPVLIFFHKNSITANQITWFSILWSFLIAVLFWFADVNRWLFLVLPLGLFIRMALNALDGMMARIYNQQSKKGEVLNETGDIVSDIAIFLPLLKFEHSIYLIVIFICLSIINEFSGVLAKVISGERRYEGPMGKSDRAFIMGVYGLLAFFGLNGGTFTFFLFIAVAVLIVVSTYTRIKKSLENGSK